MKQNQATRRLAHVAQQKLGSIMMFEISDPDLELLTITGVEVSVDRSIMKVYVSCDSAKYHKTLAALKRAKGRIRTLLSRALEWRVAPDLIFEIDTSTDEAERIAKALETLPPTIDVEKDEFGYPLQ